MSCSCWPDLTRGLRAAQDQSTPPSTDSRWSHVVHVLKSQSYTPKQPRWAACPGWNPGNRDSTELGHRAEGQGHHVPGRCHLHLSWDTSHPGVQHSRAKSHKASSKGNFWVPISLSKRLPHPPHLQKYHKKTGCSCSSPHPKIISISWKGEK